MSKIRCGTCHVPLENDDNIIMDFFNTLTHRGCYQQDPKMIIDVDTFKNLKVKVSPHSNNAYK
ncbi:hypothetical protein [Heyndrickxia sporothermodurans]|uniref:hypothetical protein n=1 Tax=Heyndrickxia sporothermodurans TaxID=46224 RepID=UPI002E24C9ED|nr:hypothetical protein [Heyndrickxia sporothermodurans]